MQLAEGDNHMVNQKWLLTFMSLAETRHFTLTAEKLHMTQPGVSQHIHKLEAQLQTPLLHRYGKQFELTLAGEKLYAYGLQAQALHTELAQSIELDDPLQGQCRIACSGALAMYLYPFFLNYQSRHQGISISLEAAPNQNIINDLLENKTDIGIVTQEQFSEQLTQTYVGEQALQLVLPKQYENENISFDFLNSLGFINHPDGFHFLEKVLKANNFSDYKNRENVHIKGYINQLSQILSPVSKGLGYTVLPASAVAQFESVDMLSIAALEFKVSEKLYLTKKRHRELPARYQWFEQKIKDLLGN
ncbi:LysR family transcriptional regulator [Psychromonas ossibalaenae]|uniref:LysR family transcriptional regulator n=1 Tax=Psychromonas ossibalaenae TaxID=444922 RepID=UPI00037600A4|nr:LysR family transcriptional regulator [Psychromonas ossibalaenae]